MQVLVIGAGINGIATASFLQQRGFAVSLLERNSSISSKALAASAEYPQFSQLLATVAGCISFESGVSGLSALNDLVSGVRVGEQLLRADYYVLAAGKSSPCLLRQIGIRHPRWRRKGFRLVANAAPFLGRCSYANLLLNGGDASMDWTLACAWAQYLTDLLSGRPAVSAANAADPLCYR